MYSFRNDYSEGAHPQVLQALTDTNLVQTCGYGVDPICEEARDLIRTVCAAPEADVHFLVGGTQTNLTVITALLASYEAVIAAHTGHVNCHETGAIEATGHKVCTGDLPGRQGDSRYGGGRSGPSTTARSTWSPPRWSTFPIPPRSAPSTPRRS